VDTYKQAIGEQDTLRIYTLEEIERSYTSDCPEILFHDFILNSTTIKHHLANKHLSCACEHGSPCHVQEVLLPIARGEK
jgi:hypothetical protein